MLDFGGDEGRIIPNEFEKANRYVYDISGNEPLPGIGKLNTRNERLEDKVFKAKAKAAKFEKKATMRSESDWRYKRASKLESRSAKLHNKAHKLDDHTSDKYLKTERKATKLSYKASKLRYKASKKGMADLKNVRLMKKANKQHLKASGYEYATARNNLTIKTLKQRNIKLGERLINEAFNESKD